MAGEIIARAALGKAVAEANSGLEIPAVWARAWPVQQLRTRRRRNPEVWHKASRLIAALILLGLVAFVLMAFHPEWDLYRNLAVRLDEEQAVLREQELLLETNERELHLLQNDPEYVEILARDTLGVMKPDEEIIRLDSAAPKPSGIRVAPPSVP